MKKIAENSNHSLLGFATFDKPFRPPFKGLATTVWLYFIFCYLFVPNSYVLRGGFVETDNYTYLIQTLDWVQGQGWFDNVQHRLGIPPGVFIHFNRLAEIPIAAFIVFFRLFNLPWVGAATLAAIVYPPCLLLGLFWAVRWVSESFVPHDWTGASAYLLAFSQALLFQFSLGHVGHRAPELILVLLVTGCVFRTMEFPQQLKWSVRAAVLLAFSLALGLEVLPWVLVLSAWWGGWLLVEGRPAVRSTIAFAGTFTFAGIVFLLLYRPPSDWFAREIMSYSYVYVLLQAGIGFCLLCAALAAKASWTPLRYIWGLTLPIFMGCLFLHSFPELLAGPYGAMDKNLAATFFGVIAEARPLTALVSPLGVFASLGIPLMAVGVGSICLWQANRVQRWAWGLSLVLLIVAILLTAFYQLRFFRYANLFAVIPLTVLLHRGWCYFTNRYKGVPRLSRTLLLVVVVGPLFAVFIPAMYDGRPFWRDILMYPAPDIANGCDLKPVEGFLQSPLYYGKKPLLIMNTMSTGPEILFRTFHRVMAAPYHYNVRGNLDDIKFFGALTADEAKQIAIEDTIDLVLICKSALKIYGEQSGAQPFIDQLKSGNVPWWLMPADLGTSSNFLLFEVNPNIFDSISYH